MKTVKVAKFAYEPNAEIPSLLEKFRQMCNDAIRIALSTKPKNRFDLIRLACPRLREYGLHSHYILSASEVAYSVYKNKRRRNVPYVRKPFLKLDNQTYRLNYLLLRIPVAPRRHVFLNLKGSSHHRSILADKSVKLGSITITESGVMLAFSKEIGVVEPADKMGIDVNERNVTWSDSRGGSATEDTSDVCEIKERYKAIRAKIAQRTYRDRRIQQRLLAKYARRDRNKTIRLIHLVSKRIVNHARQSGLGIVMERLTGIRRLYRRGNWQGSSYRGRLNSWMFREIQRQIDYKASWEGISVSYVSPRGTSRNCPDCGSRVAPLQERKVYCVECDKVWDRDVLASLNIMAVSSVRAARSPKCSYDREPRRQEKAGNPLSRKVEGDIRKSGSE